MSPDTFLLIGALIAWHHLLGLLIRALLGEIR